MVSRKKALTQLLSDGGEGDFSNSFGFGHRQRPSTGSSTETVLYYPQPRSENIRQTSSSTLYRTDTDESSSPCAAVPQALSLPSRSTSATDFDSSVTQEAHWPLPDNLTEILNYQAKQYAQPKPKGSSFAQQARTQDRLFDPDFGAIYSHCTECDPSGGPTDCQHPEDPQAYDIELNPVPENDPAFALGKLPEALSKKQTPATKLISKPSPSRATVTKEGKLLLTLSPPSGIGKAAKLVKGFSQVNLGKTHQSQHPDEMLAARHLSDFLTENVEEGVATSYIIFSTHGTLLGYSSPLPVKIARNIAALASITWRTNDQAHIRGLGTPQLTGGASLLKIITVTKAEKGPGLFNMICSYKDLLMAVQWIQDGFLAAAMIEADIPQDIPTPPEPHQPKQKGRFETGASASEHHDDDAVWEDEEAVEETSEDEDERVLAQEQGEEQAQKQDTEPSKQMKLFERSQGLASALREQWKVDGFKMPPGFR